MFLPLFQRLTLSVALFGAMAVWCAVPAWAWQPERVTVLLGHAADGFDGRLTRAFARAWSHKLLAPVVVVARGRDSALMAASEFLRSPRDGTVVLGGDLGRLAIDYARERPAWAWTRVFEHLYAYALDPAVLFTGAGAGIDDLDDVAMAAGNRDYAIAVGRWRSLENVVLLDAARQAGLRFVVHPAGSGESLISAVKLGSARIAVGRVSDITPHRRDVHILAGLGIVGGLPFTYRHLDSALRTATAPAGRVDAITVHAGLARTMPDRFATLKRTLAETIAGEEFTDALESLGLRPPGQDIPGHDQLIDAVRHWWDAQTRVADALASEPKAVRTRGRIERIEDGGRRLRYLGLDGEQHDMLADPDWTELTIDDHPVRKPEPLAEIRPGMICQIAWPSSAAREAAVLSCRSPR